VRREAKVAVPSARSSRARRCVLSFLLLLPELASGAPPQRARIVGLRVRGDADAAVVEVAADRPVSFTTLRLSSPPRLVLDFADADLSGVPAEQEVEDGTIRRVGAAAAGAQTARVVVELAGEAEFDVHADGARLEVRVLRLRPALAAAEPAGAPDRTEASAAASSPESEAEAALEARKRASLPTVSLAGLAPAHAPQEAPDASATEASATSPSAVSSPAADSPAAGSAAGAPALATAHRQATRAEAAPQRASPRGRPSISGIGFHPQGAGEVIVRSDRELEYGVESQENAVLLHLAGAGIPLANNRRPLETSVFGGPVQRIIPLPGPGGTDVRIELREKAAFALRQDGGVLTLTFNR
jgi:hypothetical protein